MRLNPVTHALFSLTAGLALLFAAGCGGKDGPGADGKRGGDASLPAGLFLDAAPDGAQSITALKTSAKEGDEVVVHVIVGGGESPIVSGRASAMVVDASLDNHCLSDDDHCAMPWDYCCTPPEDKTANLATLQVVDANGKVLAADLSKHFKPLSTLTIKGVVGPRANDDVLTINATGIFVGPIAQ